MCDWSDFASMSREAREVNDLPEESIGTAESDETAGAAESVVEAADEAAVAPVAEPADEAATEPVDEAAVGSADEPGTEPVAEPVDEAAVEPATESVVESAGEAVAGPAGEQVAEPGTEPVDEPGTEPVAEPAGGAAAEPVGEMVTEPSTEPVVEEVAESVVGSAGGAADVWGRVAVDGTVYVRTADGGEHVVGSWAAGSPDEALAYFHRKYEGLRVEIELLERRVHDTDLAPRDALAAIEKLREAVTDAHAVGDLAALAVRLDGLVATVDERRAQRKAAREQAQSRAREAKERIVTEAESLAHSEDWRVAGERLRALVDEWKSAARLDRKTDDELWHRFSQARSAFSKRRKSHFARLDGERVSARERKEKLVAEAEQLAGSTDWNDTAARYRDLMREWKVAGRAHRDVDDALWARFRAAQDTFFAARNSVFDERDTEQRGNQSRKEELVTEAEKLLPIGDPKAARAALRSIHERWEALGPVPREARGRLESGLRAVERAVETAEDAEWRRTNPEARARAEATVKQLRESIASLEKQANRAREAGNQRKLTEAEQAIAARREWLAEAEKVLADFTR
jgi:hypothetical protein